MAKRRVRAKDIEITIEDVPYRKGRGKSEEFVPTKMSLEEKIAAALVFFLFLAFIALFMK